MYLIRRRSTLYFSSTYMTARKATVSFSKLIKTFINLGAWEGFSYNWIQQGCTNPVGQVSRSTKCHIMSRNNCGCSIQLLVTIPASEMLRWLLHFCTTYTPLGPHISFHYRMRSRKSSPGKKAGINFSSRVRIRKDLLFIDVTKQEVCSWFQVSFVV